MSHVPFRFLVAGLSLAALVVQGGTAQASKNVFGVAGNRVLFNGQPFKVIGLRLSNALISDAEARELVDSLDTFKSYGVNTVSVFLMGSRFGDVKGYRPDASLDPTYAERLGRIIEAADARDMIVLVGCLYWSTSRANDELGAWTQQQANLAVANTVRWLGMRGHRNVIVDVDNEGMAHDATGWSIASMIDAAHAVDRSIMVAYNDAAAAPANADLYIHHSPRVAGKPWIESEGSAPEAPGGYWGSYSKEDGYYNYIRIGRYTPAMKAAQIAIAKRTINDANGYMMASTWLQAAPAEGIGGPFMSVGGLSEIPDVNADLKRLHPDAGVRWWLEAMRAAYGAWAPPQAAAGDAGVTTPAVDARVDVRAASSDTAAAAAADTRAASIPTGVPSPTPSSPDAAGPPPQVGPNQPANPGRDAGALTTGAGVGGSGGSRASDGGSSGNSGSPDDAVAPRSGPEASADCACAVAAPQGARDPRALFALLVGAVVLARRRWRG